MKFNTTPVRGTVDYLPNEMEVRSYAERIILDTYKENGFLQIKTPILENLDLLTNGDSGDNQKLMFKTVKRGEKLDLSKPNLTEKDIVEEGLRYDLTVPLVRFFSNNREKLPYPFKAIQIDEAFRAERPQKGRVRQFTQCDIDILGDSSIFSEIELLLAGAEAYAKLGFKNLTIKVNDRKILNELIKIAGFEAEQTAGICISLDKLDKIGIENVKEELKENGYEIGRVEKLLDMFNFIQSEPLIFYKNNTNAINGISPSRLGIVNDNNLSVFDRLIKLGISAEVVSDVRTIICTVQDKLGSGFIIQYDPTIIRGQGYYTGTVFEVYDSEFGRALGGGGRYDKMVEKFTGAPVPAVGFSIGFYSVVMLMLERKVNINANKLALVYGKEDSFPTILDVKKKFIEKGYFVSVFSYPKNFNNFAEKLRSNNINKLVKMSDQDKIIDL